MVELVKAADILSGKSDRWFFVIVLLLLLAFGWLAIRYLVGELKEARTAYHSTLRDIIKEQETTIGNLQVSLDRNTEALKINNTLLSQTTKHNIIV